jgi:hypothetical protein
LSVTLHVVLVNPHEGVALVDVELEPDVELDP